MDDLATTLGARLLNGAWRLDEAPLRPEGSGQAWLFGARDERTDERVVVKIFKPSRARDFEREIAALTALSGGASTRTAPFRGHGAVACGASSLPYVVMGFVEGLPLDELIAGGLLSLDERLEILAQIAEGLAELHGRSVIHRDLKPSNILVRLADTDSPLPGDTICARLVDFGISTVLGAGEDGHLTTFKGTPLYMAPEQMRGRGVVTLATDLFAFGLLARDLLLGERRREWIAASQAVEQIAAALDQGGYARRSSLADIFRACLAEEPRQRLASGVELAERLRSSIPRPDVPAVFPRCRALRSWRRRALRGDAGRSLGLLADWAARFCGAVLLACLPEARRREAQQRIARGEPLHEVVEALAAGEPPAHPAHPAAEAALAFWSLRVTEQGRLLDFSGRGRAAPTDATLLPRTLLENARSAAEHGTEQERVLWTRALCDGLLGEPLFQDFTLARSGAANGAPALLVRCGAEEREQPWQRMIGDGLSPREPLLVRVNRVGRPEPGVPPVRLAPFAALGEDTADLLFLGPSSSGAQRFATPLSAEVASTPDGIPGAESAAPAPRAPATIAPERPFSALLPCRARPVIELVGRSFIYLGTEAGEWMVAGARGESYPPLRRLPGCFAAALDARGHLLVGTLDATVARARAHDWEYTACEAPILSLATAALGVLAGDAAGAVTLLPERGEPVSATTGAPITDVMAAGDGGVAAIDAAGALWIGRWPGERGAALERVSAPEIGRPYRLFACAGGERIGAFGAERAALIHVASRAVEAVSGPLGGGIREVRALRPPALGYALLTDEGELLTVDAGLAAPQRVRLPRSAGPIAGARPLDGGAMAVWTAAGELFLVGRERAVRRVADEGVCLAFGSPGSASMLLTVRYREAEGAELRCEPLPAEAS